MSVVGHSVGDTTPIRAFQPVMMVTFDTLGGSVPTYGAQTFTYDASNNLETATITDGTNTWVRTYTYTDGNQTSDSGWVKQ